MTPLAQAERDRLLQQAWQIRAQVYPPDRSQAPSGRQATRLLETYYRILAEYADRLPRVRMSACPFTSAVLKRSFDPWGVDGPWWHRDRLVVIEEPAPPDTFKVLLGALAFHGRAPVEARHPVIPGPEAPFVVPRLLHLPEMVAVVSRLALATGDTAYPIAYFSPETIAPARLHQAWLREDHWFKLENGKTAWLIANDPWDFELQPWIDAGKLRWIDPDDPDGKVVDGRDGKPCPYVNLPGDRCPQALSNGNRELSDPPDGTPITPFE
jgi:hypothetical protein